MVTNVTSLTGNGLKDWLIQRLSAVYLLVYSVFFLGFILYHPHINYTQWHALFTNVVFKGATILALLLLSLHAWIGIWTVTTDYLTCTAVRLSIQIGVCFWLLSQFIWGLQILWGQ
ncbi:MAG: succinate dehydrogenase, hydrophobic membrane anchor protein [Legionella sp.]|nr:succinate dehydrogenase, hydrophobic membrane anchor protein [Legionella sp.]